MPEKLEGVVETIIFQSNDNTFCVFKINTADGLSIPAVMNSVAPLIGEEVELQGEWVMHARFGRQFKAHSYSSTTETSVKGIQRFLGSGAVKGLGHAMAARIVAHFGLDTLQVLNENPARLTEVSGIGKKKAEAIFQSYSELAEIRELMLFLEENGISSNYAPKLQSIYGAATIELVKTNPYRLIYDVEGIGFRIADRIAAALGFLGDDERRIKAGLEYALQKIAQAGHVCVPQEILRDETAKLLYLDTITVEDVLRELLVDDILLTETFGGQCLVYPEYLYRAETGVAERLVRLKGRAREISYINTEKIIESWEFSAGIKLADIQKEAIESVLRHGVLVVTGGPGTGKTTLIKGIISVLEKAGCSIKLAAPTGRAARRLAESAGRSAYTVHKLLEYAPHEGPFAYGRNEDNPLEADVVIVDEASMLDITLTDFLLKAIALGTRLILVGDIDQLPAVGPGSVLKDVIASQQVPVVRLNEVFRQEAQSKIVLNAHAINRGVMPELNFPEEFSFCECENETRVAEQIVDLYAQLVQKYSQQEIQILSPMHKMACGVENLNKLLQEKINPPAENKNEIATARQILREGDKIMQIRNNYDKEVFNGDLGVIQSISGRNLHAYFPDVNEGIVVKYEQGELDELQLSYAMSVHKSQGSEYPIVILALSKGHYVFLQRNLLYTAITRAKNRVFIIGQEKSLRTAIGNDRMRRRYSLLKERLNEELLY